MADNLDLDQPIAEVDPFSKEIKATAYFENYLFEIISSLGGEGSDIAFESVDTMADLLKATQNNNVLHVKGFHTTGDEGGGEFYYDSTKNRNLHNGGTIIDPTNTADLSTWNAAAKTTWFTAGSGTGCWIRLFSDVISDRWFGTKPGQDDTQSIQNLFIFATTKGTGTFKGARISVSGDYELTTLDFSVTDVSVENQEWIGDGGETGDASTRFIFKPSSSSSTGLLLKSITNFKFSNIEFIAGNSNCTEVILIHAFDDPVFSSYINKFERCSFRAFSGQTVSVALVNMKNTAQTIFEHCWWSGDQNSIRLGENAGVDSGTFGNGAVGNTTFKNCFISTDIRVRSSINTSFQNTEFGRNSITLVPARIIPEGDQNQRNTSITDCVQVSVNAAGTGTFYTQGTSGKSLYAVNNRIKSYAINFLINAGGCTIKNNLFQDMGAAQIGIQLGANATECNITPNDFSDLISNSRTPIDDNRSSPRWPLIVDQALGSDHTFVGTGSFEDIISVSSITHNGGALKVRWAAFLNSAAAATYTFQFLIDGTIIQGLSGRGVVPSGDDRDFSGEAIIALDTKSTGVIFKLQAEQSTGTLSTIEAQSTSFSTYIQVEEI